MSSPNVDLVRSIFEAWEHGDYSLTDWAHPEIEFVFADGPDPGKWVGLAAMAERWREQLSPWEGHLGVAEGYRELDGERVLVLSHFTARGKASGVEVGQMTKGACLFHVHKGNVTRLALYWDRDRAFADLGLVPETDAGSGS